MLKYLYLLLITLMLVSCSSSEIPIDSVDKIQEDEVKEIQKDLPLKIKKNITKIKENPIEYQKPNDSYLLVSELENIPQNILFYTKKLNKSVDISSIQNRYEKQYFNVWNVSSPRESVRGAKWSYRIFKYGNSYGENLQLLKQEFFDKMLENANFKNYGLVNKKAISLKNLDIRAFPTHKPLLRNPSKAGEGFPFDYLQNSTIHANKPLFISHYSKDRAWVYVFSSFASGWVDSKDVAILKAQHTKQWQKAQQIVLTKENIPLHSKNGTFLFYSKIGTMLPLISQDKNFFTVLAISAYKNNEPLFEQVLISKKIAHKGSLKLKKDALENIMSEVMKSNYGWGGSYGQRDCSSTTRDLFAPFGIWLPRNSTKQSKIGKVISLENLSDDEKISIIKEKAIPFETLLFKRGHIVLYVGLYKDEIVIFHNIWGIKTKKDGVEGRAIIGKTIFSTLEVGKNIDGYDKNLGILRNLKSMNIITR